MAAKESISITYYVGLLNIALMIIWVALYGLNIVDSETIKSSTATPFYVGTLFALGFGIIFPFFEKTMSGKQRINQGLIGSFIALVVYAGMVAMYFTNQSLVLYNLRQHF
ncbi:MAG: hypothetical protein KF696_13215 [Planctomycetes bacterium]|nr:hypothetical protein [Planctomycetota bacterium]MCW8135517.1 hypothetical protein [Planctomycetota bacterium]